MVDPHLSCFPCADIGNSTAECTPSSGSYVSQFGVGYEIGLPSKCAIGSLLEQHSSYTHRHLSDVHMQYR